MNPNRRDPLCEGVCDICHKKPAQIPFDGIKRCYGCWNDFWHEYMRRAKHVKKQRTKRQEAIEKIKEQTILNFLRNQ